MADRGNEARRTRGPQRNERLVAIAAVFLDLPHRGMADTIDRKENRVGPAHQAWQRGQVFLDASVMRNQRAPSPGGERFQLIDQSGASANIQHGEAIQIAFGIGAGPGRFIHFNSASSAATSR